MLISRIRIPPGSLKHYVVLHPSFGYQLYSAASRLVGVVRWDGEHWSVNGAAMDYEDAHGLVERWYRDGKPVLLWQCCCEECQTPHVKRMAEYVDAPITHGVCAAGGAKMILQTNRELDELLKQQEAVRVA